MKFNLPYDNKHLEIEIDDRNFAGALVSKVETYDPGQSQEDVVEAALDAPLASPQLEELVQGKKNIVIIDSDHTRPVPSKILTPILLRRIRSANPDAQITILVATGSHRPSTGEELLDKYGQELVDKEEIVMHRSHDDASMVKVGTLPNGGECLINKVAVEADLLLAQGFIEPHLFAGFSGGRKSVLPGIASYKTILANHCSEFIASDKTRPGILEGNPIHEDMLYAAKVAGLKFILNVVMNSERRILGAFAGDLEQAHLKGTEFLSELARVNKIECEIVVTTNGGYPLDQNIYQAVKGMVTAESASKKGDVIIQVAGLRDGTGGKCFYNSLAQSQNPQQWLESVAKNDRSHTVPEQWASQILARILDHRHVLMVSDLIEPELVTNMHMEHAKTFDEAWQRAYAIKGKDAKVVVIPDGLAVIPS